MRRPIIGVLDHVKPTFMLPAVGVSVYGAALAPTVDWLLASLYAAAVGAALFIAHLRDGYVDGHCRAEEQPSLSRRGFRYGLWGSGVVVVALTVALLYFGVPRAAASVVALVGLAVLHAPTLDRHPLSVTIDYPVGIAIATLGGFLAQTGRVAAAVVIVAVALAVVLSGIKIGIDQLDAGFDRSIGKQTIPVRYGATTATVIAAAVFAVSAATIAGSVATGRLPSSALWVAPVPIACAATALATTPRRAVRIQMALTYVFAAGLFIAVCDGSCAPVTVLADLRR